MTQDEIKALAKQAGGTPYVNRHYPDKLAVAFSGQALIDFVALVQAHPGTCQWTPMDDDTGSWESACGEAWTFNDGGPKENNCHFCHGCGKPVEVVE